MFNTTEELIQDIKEGKMVILLDDEDRENEGDFVMAAEHVNSDAINFMVHHGRGLICLPMTQERCQQLNIGLMIPRGNRAQFGTNFTVSIEASEGVTTGISAADRAHTIKVAVSKNAKPQDIVQPGHIFPIIAQNGGVFTRAGHTEASCDLARLAGLEPAAVIVEILNEDGSMARGKDLFKIAQQHNVKIGTIADLVRYRIRTEDSVERLSSIELKTEYGNFILHSYLDNIDNQIHYAFVKGDILTEDPIHVRVHYRDDLGDILGISQFQKSWPLADALKFINKKNTGIVVIISSGESSGSIQNRLESLELGNIENPEAHIKTIGTGARILKDLGVKKIINLSSPRKMSGLSGYDIEIIKYVDFKRGRNV